MTARTPIDRERGAVLITTLLLMSVVAVITLTIMDDIRFSVKRAVSTQTAEQLDWYGRGGEAFAQNWLTSQLGDGQAQLHQAILRNVPAIFPLEDGEMRISMGDGRNCFNINAMVPAENRAETRIQLALLIRWLEFDPIEAESIAVRIQDWIDADSTPEQGGAEDFAYTNLKPPYHAANTAMVDITELREIQGLDEETFRRLRPYLCALPDVNFSQINVNTLSELQAPLLGVVFAKEDGLSIAQQIIAERPAAGYENVEAIWEREDIVDLDLNGAGKSLVGTETDRVDLQIDIRLGEQQRGSVSRFAINGGNQISLVSRRSSF